MFLLLGNLDLEFKVGLLNRNYVYYSVGVYV